MSKLLAELNNPFNACAHKQQCIDRIAELEHENSTLHRMLAANPDVATSTGASQAAMGYEIEIRDKRIAEFEAGNLCTVCTGNPISPYPCICGGSGTVEGEAQGLRELVVELEQQKQTAYEEVELQVKKCKRLRDALDEVRDICEVALRELNVESEIDTETSLEGYLGRLIKKCYSIAGKALEEL